jgi:endonuclease I
MKSFFYTTTLLNSVCALHYLPYNQIRPLFLKLYHTTHPNNVSLEHIVPQSLFKKKAPKMSRDMHNLMLYPNLLNSHRSNYRYSNELVLDDTTTILSQNGEKSLYPGPFNHIGVCLKSNKKRCYYPRPFYRGKIARACMYMAMTYPDFQNEIFNRVIDPYVLLTWHHEHPVSGFEIRKNQEILNLQENENTYVSTPEMVLKDMEHYLGKRIAIYHDYQW